MLTIPLTHGFVTIVDPEDFDEHCLHKWHLSGYGYAARTSKPEDHTNKNRLIYMHRKILCAPPRIEVDHINGDKLDNRRSNLRLCTRAGNQYNQHKIRGVSRFKGVSLLKGKWWRAMIQSSPGVRLYLGSFRTEVEAAQVYDAAALLYHGEFARTNKSLGLY